MQTWQEDMLTAIDDDSLDPTGIYTRIEAAARSLGFEYCTYGIRVPIPVTRPRVSIVSNYPAAWLSRYEGAHYVQTDPTVIHGRKSQKPLVWSNTVFATTPALWDEAQAHGLKFGWGQSSLDGYGLLGMLVLARSAGQILPSELKSNEIKMRWLTSMAHTALSPRIVPELAGQPACPLTQREVQILQWTADGKTAGEISDILNLSDHTVNFHVGNAMRKLGTSSKTAAAVKAAVLGLL